MSQLNSYKDVQALLNKFVMVNNLTPSLAPHGVFWETLTYEQFISGTVPGIGVPILDNHHPENSYIINVLKGPYNGFNQMPRPNPPYNQHTPEQSEVITLLSDWIARGCPDNAPS